MTPELQVWHEIPFVLGFSFGEVWMFLGPLVAGFVAALLTHVLSSRRDRENHKMQLDYEAEIAARQARREHLLEAYRTLDATEPKRLEYLANNGREELSFAEFSKTVRKRGPAFGDVLLFGDEELASHIYRMIDEGGDHNSDALMNLLRDKLRAQFGMEKTNARYQWVEIHPKRAEKPADEAMEQ